MKILKLCILLTLVSCQSNVDTGKTENKAIPRASSDFTRWKTSVKNSLNASQSSIPKLSFIDGTMAMDTLDSSAFNSLLAGSREFGAKSDSTDVFIMLYLGGLEKHRSFIRCITFTDKGCREMVAMSKDRIFTLPGDELECGERKKDIEALQSGHSVEASVTKMLFISHFAHGHFNTNLAMADTGNKIFKYFDSK